MVRCSLLLLSSMSLSVSECCHLLPAPLNLLSLIERAENHSHSQHHIVQIVLTGHSHDQWLVSYKPNNKSLCVTQGRAALPSKIERGTF